MQIDRQPLQVNARRLNVPRVLYGAGTAVSFSKFHPCQVILTSPNIQDVRDGGWNVVGKKFSSPKTFASWAVIDFVTDKLSADYIGEKVRALASCCQQLGKFCLWILYRKPIFLILILAGMGMVFPIRTEYTYPDFMLP